ncbi:hypothetical protein VE04_04361 [Pseudogymnoascus sp. 24MN13]|nr:hypothetical protein VE04_04361 [Pseudogymnoascus sp. 24MN13]
MSNAVPPKDGIRIGPPPVDVPRDAKPQPSTVETQVADGDVDDDSTSPRSGQLDTVLGDGVGDATGSTLAIPLAKPDAPTTEDVVSVHLEKFERLLELLADVVRESKATRQVEPDIERGNTNTARNWMETNQCHTYCDFPHGRYLGNEDKAHRKKAIDDLWNSVEPWDMARLSKEAEEPSQGTTSYASDKTYDSIRSTFADIPDGSFPWRHERVELIATELSEFSRIHRTRDDDPRLSSTRHGLYIV